MNQQEFNYDLFLTGKYRLVTRGGTEVPREAVKPYKSITFPYCYLHPNGTVYSLTKNGRFKDNNRYSEYDLFMIPIQTDETIPFDLDKFKSGEWDVVSTNTGETAEFAKWLQSISAMGVIWNDECNEFEQHEFNLLRLKRKPITPYRHPHLYEVSYNGTNWIRIKKYYDEVEGVEFAHKVLLENNACDGFTHLRLKQPTEITKDQAFDALWNKLEVPITQQVLTEKFRSLK